MSIFFSPLSIPIPLNAWQGHKTPDHIVSLIDELLEQHAEVDAAKLLNERGCRSPPHF
jgi:hypothetical protein